MLFAKMAAILSRKRWVNNIPVLVQMMAWCKAGDKQFSEPMLTLVTDTYMRHSASMA